MANTKTNELLQEKYHLLITPQNGIRMEGIVWEGPKGSGFVFLTLEQNCYVGVLYSEDMGVWSAKDAARCLRQTYREFEDCSQFLSYEQYLFLYSFGADGENINEEALAMVEESLGSLEGLQTVSDDIEAVYFDMAVQQGSSGGDPDDEDDYEEDID